MITPDICNGLFELIGSVFMWKNVAQLHKDKQIRGSYWPAWVFFALWGIWNLWYYPSLNQWMSFLGCTSLASGNVVWCLMAWKYRNK